MNTLFKRILKTSVGRELRIFWSHFIATCGALSDLEQFLNLTLTISSPLDMN